MQRAGVHPMDFLAERLRALGLSRKRLGYESDTYHFSQLALDALRSGLPETVLVGDTGAQCLTRFPRKVRAVD